MIFKRTVAGAQANGADVVAVVVSGAGIDSEIVFLVFPFADWCRQIALRFLAFDRVTR